MNFFQIIDPHKAREFIIINEPFLKKLVKEEPRESKRGRKRIAERWVILALAIIARIEGIAWRKLEEKLSLCDFLIEEGWMKKIPSKSTFHAVWRATESKILEQWIIELGREIVRKKGLKAMAVDSSGFKIRQASVWRFLKWVRGGLKKTSKLFWKIHLIVGLPSRAIVSLAHSASNTHDSKVFGLLWQKLPSALLRPFLRFYGDCAYWTENIVGLLSQHSFFPVIPPKSNARYPSPPPLGPIVQAHRLYPGLYRRNHHPEYRSSIEHVFGLLKLSLPPILDRLPSTILSTLYSSLLCYNYLLLLRTV
ncbi:MAG: transposase [Candidatus Heimdallarchaeum endolithica]|uniref:Transposase n=1 Tax=Candidatus Heimdallarchaeum endolithica TaxID=2876572 RepID=A0A9Y1FPH8_9ARCH|nr:MAG: transposase [Candidatus Heimdallarchaeum endolithica]